MQSVSSNILSGSTTPGLNGPGSDGNDGVLRIPQSSANTGISLSDCLVTYTGQSWYVCRGVSYPSAGIRYVYFTTHADWAVFTKDYY